MKMTAGNRQTISFLRRRFEQAGLQPDGRHGQNFLFDLNLLALLVDSGGCSLTIWCWKWGPEPEPSQLRSRIAPDT